MTNDKLREEFKRSFLNRKFRNPDYKLFVDFSLSKRTAELKEIRDEIENIEFLTDSLVAMNAATHVRNTAISILTKHIGE